jgi:hypothetical protein
VAFDFEKLLVYQKAVDFADQICSHTERFQRGYGFLVDQLNRAALSISANIAEGNGRFTKADRRNFFGIARLSSRMCPLARARSPPTTDFDRRTRIAEGPPRRNRPHAVRLDQGPGQPRTLTLACVVPLGSMSRYDSV